MTRGGQPEQLIPVEHLHQRFDEAYDRAEVLRALIAQRAGTGVDLSILIGKLKEAEAEKKAALADLRKARHLKVVPRAGTTPMWRMPGGQLAGKAGGS